MLTGAEETPTLSTGKKLWAVGSTVCPRCSGKPLEEPEVGARVGLGRPNYRKARFEPGTIGPPPVGIEECRDHRSPCPPHERPTDEEAIEAGFESAQDWYVLSNSGELQSPEVVAENFASMPEPLADTEDDVPVHLQWWKHIKGVKLRDDVDYFAN